VATWLDFCTKRPGPLWKQGYGGVIASRPLTIIEGEVKHITLGPMSATLGVLDGPRQASWPFTIPKIGIPLQHYPLESVCWHAGLMGDADLDTELIGNISLVGEEHEGVDGDSPTDSQFHWSLEISKEVRWLCPLVAAYPPELAVNLWEHNWLVATSCPNRLWSHARNNWTQLTDALEDDMPTLKEITDALRPVIATESKKAAVAALVATAKSVTEIRNALRGGDLPGVWWKVKGKGTIYYVEYIGGVLVRHHARNPASYTRVGGNWKWVEVSQAQLDVTIAGPRLPDLNV